MVTILPELARSHRQGLRSEHTYPYLFWAECQEEHDHSKARLSHGYLKPRCERSNLYKNTNDHHAPRTFLAEHETGTLNSVRAGGIDLPFELLDIIFGKAASPIFLSS